MTIRVSVKQSDICAKKVAMMSEIDYRVKCLKQQINACYVCGEADSICVHHINGDRSDNRLENLIPLCLSCHGKVHTKFSHGPVIDRLSKKLPNDAYMDTPNDKEAVILQGIRIRWCRKRVLDHIMQRCALRRGSIVPHI